jgi:hypothetical protein
MSEKAQPGRGGPRCPAAATPGRRHERRTRGCAILPHLSPAVRMSAEGNRCVPAQYALPVGRGGRAVHCTGLENRRAQALVGSNPTPSVVVSRRLVGGLLTHGPRCARASWVPLRASPGGAVLRWIPPYPPTIWRVMVSRVPSGGKASPGSKEPPLRWSRMVFRALERTPPGQL